MALAPYSMIIKGSVEKVKAICQKYGVEIIQLQETDEIMCLSRNLTAMSSIPEKSDLSNLVNL